MGSKDFALSGFDRISIKFPMEFEIVRADSFNINVSGNETQVDNATVVQDGERLTVGYKINLASVIAAPFSRIHVRISLPNLRELDIAGAARGSVTGFNSSGDLTIVVSGASRLEMRGITAGTARWELTGASQIEGEVTATGNAVVHITGASRFELKGSAVDLEVDAAGASHIDLERLSVRNAKLRLAGATHCLINLNGKLDASLDGASRLEYQGQATLGNVTTTGASTLRHK